MRVNSRKRASRRKFLLIFTFILILGLLFTADRMVRPVIRTVASSQTQVYVAGIVQRAVQSTLEQEDIHYSSVVSLTQNNNGDTTALVTDTVRLNRLQTDILNGIIKEITAFREMTISIPLGTLIGGQWLSGLGPRIPFRLIPAGTVQTKVINSFSACGINQTHHQIKLEAKITMYAVIPGYKVSSEVETTVVLAETVIVGLVPEAYTEVYGGTDDLVGMLQDYGAAEG